MVRALLQEADLRSEAWQGHTWDSLYLGGGTPSVLPESELRELLEGLTRRFALSPGAEVTLEANPDDLNAERLAALRDSPVQRLSIGIQSFREEDLRWMNRAHDAGQALRCLDLAAAAGFEQVSADLIYGLPGLSDEAWRDNLRRVFGQGVSHLSAYALTVEEGTALAHFVRSGKVDAPPDARAAAHFDLMQDEAARAGYEPYEISNLCRGGAYARHNTAYWTGEPYLGLGPSAHSFDGLRRSWNEAHNHRYLAAIEAGKLPAESEALSPADRLNERLMTGLRTTWGCHIAGLEAEYGSAALERVRQLAEPWERGGHLVQREGHWFLSPGGRFLADRIASDLFLVEEDAELASAPAADRTAAEPAPPLRERIAWWNRE